MAKCEEGDDAALRGLLLGPCLLLAHVLFGWDGGACQGLVGKRVARREAPWTGEVPRTYSKSIFIPNL